MGAESPSVLLIQFARAPRPGQVKTRMMPELSAVQACELHCELVLWTCHRLLDSKLGDVELAVAGDTAEPLFEQCLQLGVTRVTEQSGRDLGQKMFRALSAGLLEYCRVLLVGSDCPGIDTAYLQRALLALDSVPVVVGPAVDGGYVLIGASRVAQSVFEAIPWGSERVFAETVAALQVAGLAWEELPVLPDIDRPQDLPVWEAVKAENK